MASEWRTSSWGDEISLEYGKALRGHETAQGRYRVFGANGPIGWTDEPLARGPGVILGRKGAYRGVQYSSQPFFVIDTAYYVLPKRELDMRWLYYAIRHHKLGEIDDGSPIPSTTRAAVYVTNVDVPSREEQRAIAHILGTLDDKIELNRRMSETLEAIARALFKSWFVDFDPVRAKAERRATRLPEHVLDLFPNRFDHSELGEIPAGWEVRSIYDAADVVYGAPFASSQFNSEGIGCPLIRIRDLVDEAPEVSTPEIHPKGYKVRPGEIVVGMDGQFRAYLWGGAEAWLNQRVCVFIPKAGYSAPFVRNSIIEPLARVEATESATTVIHLGKSDIDRFLVVAPNVEVLASFNQTCQPLYDRIVAAKQESRLLSQLLGALQPQLISGELRVKDADRIVEKVA
jgi:type I restriction enzyme S subunit